MTKEANHKYYFEHKEEILLNQMKRYLRDPEKRRAQWRKDNHKRKMGYISRQWLTVEV